MFIGFQILAIITVISTIISLILKKNWWIRVFDFPRLQIIILQLLSLSGLFILIDGLNFYRLVLMSLLTISTLIQILYIFPYLPISKKKLPDTTGNPKYTVSIIVSNVLMKNRTSKKLIDLVKKHQPDIFLAIETDEWWCSELAVLDEIYSFKVKEAKDNTYGIILFSNLPLEDPQIEFLIKESIPSIKTKVHLNDFIFMLRCLHPEPPSPQEAKTSKPRDRELLLVANRIKENPIPHVVLGDLNDVAWSDTSYKFEQISKLKDPRRGRGFYNTFHAKYAFMRWALDHIFVSDDFKVIKLERLPYMGSDHFPMYFEFGIE